MDLRVAYIIVTVGALLILAMLAYATGKADRPGRISPIAGLAFAFVLAGILFGEERWVGYALMGVGVALALIDIWNKSRGPVG